MHKLFLLSIFFFFSISLNAQKKQTTEEKPPTQKEINEMMKEAKEMMNDPEVQKAMKEAGINIPDMDAIQKAGKYAAQNAGKTPVVKPAKITAEAKAAALKLRLNDTNLSDYLNKVLARVEQLLSKGRKDSLNKLVSQLNNVEELSELGVMLYYQGAPSDAVWCLTKAAAKDEADRSTLNNLAAILNMIGAENISLPILRYLDGEHPENTTVLNNLGQALFGLGEIKESKKKLEECLRIYALHPQANITMCLIKESDGEDPTENIQKSLEGAFTEEAWRMSQQRNIKFDYKKFKFQTRPDTYEYFNPMKYRPPAQCNSVWDAKEKYKQWEGWKKETNKISKALSAQIELYQNEAATSFDKGRMNFFMPPMALKAQFMVNMYSKAFADAIQEAENYYQNQYQEKEKSIDRESEAKFKEIEEKYKDRFGEGKENPFKEYCADINDYRSNYLEKMAALNDQFNSYYSNNIRTYATELMYWIQMYPGNQNANKVEFYRFALWTVNPFIMVSKLTPPCEQSLGDESDWEELEVPEPDCPINFKLNLVVASIAGNCDKLGIELGVADLLYIGYEKDFKSKNSTLSFGGGVQYEKYIPENIKSYIPSIGGKVGGFVEFGKDGISDVGITTEAGVDVPFVTDRDIKFTGKLGISSGVSTDLVGPKGLMDMISGESTVVTPGLKSYVYHGISNK